FLNRKNAIGILFFTRGPMNFRELSLSVLLVFWAIACRAEVQGHSQWIRVPMGPMASLQWVNLLGPATDFKEVSRKNYRPGVSISKADCESTVVRPDFDSDDRFDLDNRISCSFAYADGTTGSLALDLSTTRIGYFGTRDTPDLPYLIKGPVANKIYSLIESA